MPPAARVLDTTSHGGTVLGPGESTVLIGGQPAAVLGDTHSCPISTNHLPSSTFIIGSGTVLIGGKPALRVGDTCVCGASCVIGDSSVIIG